jgi:lipopolysaccharide export system protein LptA
MKITIVCTLFFAAMAFSPIVAVAERADRGKPMNIEANALRYDYLRQVSIFTGNVVLNKGTIQIRGNQLEVRQDSEGYQYGKVTGTSDKLAFFRQKRDGLDEFIEGEGELLEYDGKLDTVKFTNKALLRRYRSSTLADEISGGMIVYNMLSDMFSVDGSVSKGVTSASSGRVRAMLTPKAENSAPTGATTLPGQSVPPLRATTALEGAPK